MYEGRTESHEQQFFACELGTAPRPGRFTPRKDSVPIVQEAGWAPGQVWTGAENFALTDIRSPDRPARNESQYRLSYRGRRLRIYNLEIRVPLPKRERHFSILCILMTGCSAQPASYSTVWEPLFWEWSCRAMHMNADICLVKAKGKGHPITGQESPEGEQMCSSTLPSTSTLDGDGGQNQAPAALPLGKTRYPLHRRLGRPQGRSGGVRKISPPTQGFDPRPLQPVANHYTDWAIAAASHLCLA